MKKALLYWKKHWGKTYCIYFGVLFVLCDVTFIFLGCTDIFPGLMWFAFFVSCFSTWFSFAAAFTEDELSSYISADDLAKEEFMKSKPSKTEAPSWRYFTCDEQGNSKVISIESTPEVEKQIELRVTNKQEAQDALGMIETLHRSNRISNDDYLRVKKQLTEYLKLTEEEDLKTQERESKFMSEEKLMYKAYQRSLLRQLTKLKAAMTEKDYTTAERLINEMIEDTQKNIQD